MSNQHKEQKEWVEDKASELIRYFSDYPSPTKHDKFLKSLIKFHENRGFLTSKQLEILQKKKDCHERISRMFNVLKEIKGEQYIGKSKFLSSINDYFRKYGSLSPKQEKCLREQSSRFSR